MIIYLVSLMLIFGVGCSKKEEPQRTQSREIVVSLYQVRMEEVEKTYSTKANFEAVRDVQLRPEVSGRVISVRVDEGDFVRAGQSLLNVDPSEYQNTLNQLNAQLLQARANYENQRAIVERRKELFEMDLIAREDYENAKTQLRVYEEVIRSIQSQIDNVKLSLRKTTLTAPFSGHIAQRYVNIGDYVNPNIQSFRVVTLDPIRLVFQVPQELLPFVKDGSNVEAWVEGVGNVEGKVYFVSPTVDQSRLLTCKANVSNPKGLIKPGMYADLSLVIGKESAFKLPEMAVVLVGNKKVVWKIEGDTARAVNVEVIKQGEGFVWVRADLRDGDSVALDNAQILREGIKVKVR